MNAISPFNIEIVARANVAQGKAGLADFKAGLTGVKSEADNAARATGTQAAALEKLAAATAKAALGQQDLAAAERRAAEARQRASMGPINVLAQQPAGSSASAWRAAETSAESLRASISGLNMEVGDQVREMLAASQSTQQYQAAMNEVRASFNPLFAASQRYEQQLVRIAEAEKLGAISAREAAAARERAVSIIAPATTAGRTAQGGGLAAQSTPYFAAQANDVAMMALLGQNPMMLALQQGPQISQMLNQMGGGLSSIRALGAGIMSMLNPLSLATIGVIGLGTAGVQWLGSLREETKTADEALTDLAGSVDRVGKANESARASMADLTAEFGSAAGIAQELLTTLAEIERRGARRNAGTAIASLYDEITGGSGFGLRSQSDRQATLQRMFGEANWFTAGRITEEGSPLSYQVQQAIGNVDSARRTNDLDAQIEAVEALRAAAEAAAPVYDGITRQEDEWLQKLAELQQGLLRLKALDENAAGKQQAGAMARDLELQADLQGVILQYGEKSAEARAEQNRQERESLETRLADLKIARDSVEGQRVLLALTEVQAAREAEALEARRQWLRGKQDELAAIRLEISLIGATNAEQERARALAEAELEIRDKKLGVMDATLTRVQAIAKAEADAQLAREKALQDLRLDTVSDQFDARIRREQDPYSRAELEAQKEYVRLVAEGKDTDLAAAEAARIRARAIDEANVATQSFFREQADQQAQQRLELALLGQTEEVRARVLALVQAEHDIRRLGLNGDVADRVRRNALEQAELTRAIDEQADAWKRVESAGETAIDAVLDKLKGGDVKGALQSMVDEIGGMFFDLNVRNPIKNAILGTNLGTMDSIGGLQGIWSRLTGRGQLPESDLVSMGTAAMQAMNVQAAQVNINAGAMNFAGATGLAANLPTAPLGAGGLAGSADVQSTVWSFFAAKGLAPHQIAGIMGNVATESAFNPGAVGDGGTSFGLFQHHAGRGQALLSAVGGQAGLGDVQAQLAHVWRELLTTEAAAMAKLMASTDVRGATEAFVGFERPQGYTASNPSASLHFDKRLAAAEAAMGQFETATVAAQSQLGQLGTGAAQLGAGMQQIGSTLAGTIQGLGAQHGIGGAVAGTLLTGLGQWIGIPGFSAGGWTGSGNPSNVAGLVHEEEYVFDAEATRRIGVRNLEAIRRGSMRGYRSGGFVTGGKPAVPANDGASMAGSTERSSVFNINVTGTGNQEVRDGVHAAIAEAFEVYDRHGLPDRVKAIVNDRWG